MPYAIGADGKRVFLAWTPVEIEYLEAAASFTRTELKAACSDIAAMTGRPWKTIRDGVERIQNERKVEARKWLAANMKRNWGNSSRTLVVMTPTMSRPGGQPYETSCRKMKLGVV